jgi:predicted MFS family arabinose efflux permease
MGRYRKGLFLGLMVIVLAILNADANVMTPTLAAIEKDFGITDASIGFMMALFTIIGAAVSLFWGYFSDKASRKLLFILAVLIGEIPCALTAFAQSYGVFFFLRILSGIGMGAAFPLVFSMIGDVFDQKERPVAAAALSTAIALGSIMGTLIGGYLSGTAWGWRLPFVLASAPNLIFILLFALLIPEPQKAATEEATKELVAAGLVYPKTIRLSDYSKLFKLKTNLYLLIQGIAGTIPWGSIFFINKYLNENKGLTVTNATNVFLVFGLGMLFGIIAGGKIGEAIFVRNPANLPRFCAITTLIGCAGVVYVILFAPANLPILCAAGFIAAFSAAMTGPNMKTMLLDVNAPEDRGAIFSVFNLTDSLGTGLGRFVAGILSVIVGLAGSLSICAFFWVLCAVFLWLAAPAFPKDIAALQEDLERTAAEMKLKRT